MPVAPNATALAVCSGVSALVRTCSRVTLAHHFISCAKLLILLGCPCASAIVSTSTWTISDGAVLTSPA